MPPVTISQATASSGYERFFGFSEPPFSLAVNTRFRYESASHRDALSQVSYALERREPIVVVTGEIGTGKTLLCRTVLERLPRRTFLSVINDPMLARDDLLKRILEDFGVISSAGAAVAQTSRHELVHALEKFLASLGQIDAHAVVMLDEAQHVRADVLEEIRLLANVQDNRGTLLQIVLVGQPSLLKLLDRPELAQLRQRIARFVSLNSLSDGEVKEYIAHRVTVARQAPANSNVPGGRDLASAITGWNELSAAVTFNSEAVAAVARISGGVPRIVNLVCDRALETAFTQQSRTVGAEQVAAAVSLLQLPGGDDRVADAPSTIATPEPVVAGAVLEEPASSARGPLVAAAAAVAIVATGVWFATRVIKPSQIAEPPPAATTSTPPPAAAPARAAEPPAPAPAPATAAAAAAPIEQRPTPSPAATTPPSSESVEILVASFRTETRATEVASQITSMGYKVRQRSIGGWQQVLTGPFASKEAAAEAQQALSRAGFTQTVLVRENRSQPQ
jgi:type II secretory pathway predicted ATPase ExeA/cell division septation protein DedD